MEQAKLKVRRNIYSLTPAQINQFIQAVKSLKTTGTNDYDTYVNTHSDPKIVRLIHGQPLFLPWHREFLRRFEDQLNLNFGIPYWDWTDDVGQTDGSGKVTNRGPLWQANLWGSAGFPVSDGPFTVANGWKTVPIVITRGSVTLKFDDQLRRGLYPRPSTPLTYPTQESIRELFLLNPPYDPAVYEQFRQRIEYGPHGYMHEWVGGRVADPLMTIANSGQMSFPESSVNDPIFWLHHANVDRLWAQWQRLFPTSVVEGKTSVIDMTGDTLMPPTFGSEGAVRVKDVLDISKLGYTYEASQQVSSAFRGVDTPPPYVDKDESFYTISTSIKEGDTFVWPAASPKNLEWSFSFAGPALAYIHAKREIVNAFRGEEGREDLFSATQGADGTWTKDSRFADTGQGNYESAGELGLALFQEKLYCVFRGQSGDEKLYVTARDRNGRWSKADPTRIKGYSNSGAALAVYNNKLYCVHSGARNHDDSLWWSTTTDGVNWTSDLPFPKSYSIARPALAVIKGHLYCVHRGGRGSDGNLLHWTQLISTFSGETWQVSEALPNHIIDDGPGLAIWEGDEGPNPTNPKQLIQLQRLVCLYRSPDKLAGLKYAIANVESNDSLRWFPEQPATGVSQASPALLTGPLPLTF